MRRALGKGLSQLIAEQYEGTTSEVAIEDIVPNSRQPRTYFDDAALRDLAASIKEHGILQPLLVRPLAEGKYELIAGERRLRASKLAGLQQVPVLLKSTGNQGSLEIALIENIQREDINAIECARAYRRLIDEFDLTQEQVAEKVGKSRVTIANTIRLLRLPNRAIDGLEAGLISEGHARALLAFENEAQQLAVYDQIIERNLTVRDVEKAAKQRQEKPSQPKTVSTPKRDPNDEALQAGLSEFFGGPVHLTRDGTSGQIVIDFFSDEDLMHMLDKIGFRL